MTQRGRKSSASLSVVKDATTTSVQRPGPPSDLTDEQGDEWQAVVDDRPADWFTPSNYALLSQYCRHVVTARRVAQLIYAEEASDDLDLTQLDQLYKMQEREGRSMSSLATRMRITQQALVDKRTDKGKGKAKRPWEG